jgi:hypothetical protein
MSFRAIADQLAVSASVPAPPLTQAATIDSPTDGQKFSASPITVSGFCPDESYVKLFRNNMFSGVAACVGQAYTIQTDLFEGRNTLLAQAYNITDAAGPPTPTIDVMYTPPATPGGSNGGSSGGSPYVPPTSSSDDGKVPAGSSGPLLLWSDYKFSVVSTQDVFSWKLRFQFGHAPYTVRIAWGDGSISQTAVPGHEQFVIQHNYANIGYYTVLVTGEDRNGTTTHLQLAALIKKPGTLGTIGSIVSGGPETGPEVPNYKWLLVAWPAYVVVGLMVLSYWLGERREFLQLTARYQRRRHA